MVLMAKFRPFPAPLWSETVWTELQTSVFLLGINVAFIKFVLKSISEAVGGPDGQVRAISGPHLVRDGPNSHQMIKITFRYHLYKIKFALRCIPEAVLDGLLLLGVALKTIRLDHPNHVFWHLLTTPNK